MNLLNISLVQNFAKMESVIDTKIELKIVEIEQVFTEVTKLIKRLKNENKPTEIHFREQETNSFIRQEIIEIISQSFDYLLLEKTCASFTLFCEEKSRLEMEDKYFIRWSFRGVECFFISHQECSSLKFFSTPIFEKRVLKDLRVDKIQENIMMYYGRPIEIKDLIKFEEVGDLSAIQFLTEMTYSLIEIMTELKNISSKQIYYLSKMFPLFQEESYIQKLNQLIPEQMAMTVK